ncbi:MAG: Rho termination factor N-terminal domain-containing protein [Oscillospiraceae bacterium]
MQQPITAVMHSPETLKKMNVAELKQMAKQKQIPYYNNMNKNPAGHQHIRPSKGTGDECPG